MSVRTVKKLENRLDQIAGELAKVRAQMLAIPVSGKKTGSAARSAWRRVARKVSRQWRGGGAVEEIASQREHPT